MSLLGVKRTKREYDSDNDEDGYKMFSKSKEDIENEKKKKEIPGNDTLQTDKKKENQHEIHTPKGEEVEETPKSIKKLKSLSYEIIPEETRKTNKSPEKSKQEPQVAQEIQESKSFTTGANLFSKDKQCISFGSNLAPLSNPFSNNANGNTQLFFNLKPTAKEDSNKNFFSFNKAEQTNDKEIENENENDEKDIFDDDDDNINKEEPVPLVSQDFSKFKKLFSKHIINIYVFSSKESKYISKGNGFFSIETSNDDENKPISVLVFRNQMGTKIVEGYINVDWQKFETYSKNFKTVASFSYFYMDNENKPKLGLAKIPFVTKEECEELEKSYNEAVNYLKEHK